MRDGGGGGVVVEMVDIVEMVEMCSWLLRWLIVVAITDRGKVDSVKMRHWCKKNDGYNGGVVADDGGLSICSLRWVVI